MSVQGPKIRDFTDTAGTLPVEIETAPIYELLLELFVLDDAEEADNYEEGSAWVDRVQARSTDALTTALERLRPAGEIWLALVALAHDTPAPKTVDAFVSHIEAIGPDALRRHLFRASWCDTVSELDDATVAAALEGNPAALDAALPIDPEHGDKHRGLRTLLTMDPADSLATVIDVIRRYDTDVFSAHERLEQILQRDVAAKRAMAATMPPERLVETATNGITFAMAPEVSGVVLIPSYILRPWVIITAKDGKRIFCYSVDDEHISAEPGAPPSWLVQFYKALGDERRLRILSLLAERDANLGEVAEQLDLAKSTAHHHLRMLRSAGLVRVTLGNDKLYSLRRDAVPEASHLLEAYLTAPEPSPEAATG